jgi:hypothetical protein
MRGSCSSDACRQGRDQCPTPESCWLAEPACESRLDRALICVAIVSSVITAVAAVVALIYGVIQ